MSLSPSKETFWSQHQETLKQIRGNLKTGKQVRVKSRTLLQNGSTRSRIPQPSAHRAYSRRAKSYTPPYLPRLRTPPEHNVYRSHSSLRGRKYNIVPPVQAKEAFVSESEADSWGEESDTESESIDGQPFPYGIPVYAAPPAVIYPGLPGQPLMFHPSAPPQQRHPARKLRSRDRKKQNQKKSVRFSRKPIDTARMKLAQSNPGYQKLYSDLLDSQPNQEDALSRQANDKDLFDENRNPLLQKYKYIYPIERVSSELSRPVLSDIHSNSVNTVSTDVLDVALTEPSRQVCEEIVTEEVDGFLRDLVREATSELVDEYLDVRLASSDPLEEFLTDLLNDGVSLALGVVVKETLQELTDDALIFSGSYDIIDDLMIEELNKTAPELLSEVTLDLTLDELIDDVIRSEIIEESRDIAEEVLTEADNKIKRREFREVSRQAQEKTVDALCLDYLLALVSRQGAIWSESDFANRAMDSMTLSLLLDQYFNVQKERSKTLENVALQRLHEKAVTGVAVDVLLAQLTASLDEDLADVDEYECGVSV